MDDMRLIEQEIQVVREETHYTEFRPEPYLERLGDVFTMEYLLAREAGIIKALKLPIYSLEEFFSDSSRRNKPAAPKSPSQVSPTPLRRSQLHEGSGNQLDNSLAFVGQWSASDPPVPSVAAIPPRSKIAADAFSQKGILDLLKDSPYQPVWLPSLDTGKVFPAISLEGRSKFSWITETNVGRIKAHYDPINPQDGPTEIVGKVTLVSKGTLRLLYNPHNCGQTIRAVFNVVDSLETPDMIIGEEDMLEIRELRKQSSLLSGKGSSGFTKPQSGISSWSHYSRPSIQDFGSPHKDSAYSTGSSQTESRFHAGSCESESGRKSLIRARPTNQSTGHNSRRQSVDTGCLPLRTPESIKRDDAPLSGGDPDLLQSHWQSATQKLRSSGVQRMLRFGWITVNGLLAFDILYSCRDVAPGEGFFLLFDIRKQLLPKFPIKLALLMAEVVFIFGSWRYIARTK